MAEEENSGSDTIETPSSSVSQEQLTTAINSPGPLSWSRIKDAYNHINQGKWGNGVENRVKNGALDGFSREEVLAGQQLIDYMYPKNLGGYGYSESYARQLMGYRTGGYTGEWTGDEGKLAILHSKELVLNADDTENILSAVSIIRDIVDALNPGNLIASLLSGLSPSSINNTDNSNILNNQTEKDLLL